MAENPSEVNTVVRQLIHAPSPQMQIDNSVSQEATAQADIASRRLVSLTLLLQPLINFVFNGRAVSGRTQQFEYRPGDPSPTMCHVFVKDDPELPSWVIIRKVSPIPKDEPPYNPSALSHELYAWKRTREAGLDNALGFLGVTRLDDCDAVVLADNLSHSVYNTRHAPREPRALHPRIRELIVALWTAGLYVDSLDPDHVRVLAGRFYMTAFPETRMDRQICPGRTFTFDVDAVTDGMVKQWVWLLEAKPGRNVNVWMPCEMHFGVVKEEVCIKGPDKGKRLQNVDFDEDLTWSKPYIKLVEELGTIGSLPEST